jgi:signal transduction histidine kinase
LNLKNLSAAISGALICLISLVMAGGVIWYLDQSAIAESKNKARIVVAEQAHVMEMAISSALSATYALGAMVTQGGGKIENFEDVAEKLFPYYPGIQSLQLAPAGIVRQIYPLKGNERAIGYDLLKDPHRDAEARIAMQSGQLTLAGPFELVQGGIGAAGRLPVYLPEKGGSKAVFWGFTTVLIRFPEVLGNSGFKRLTNEGYEFRLSRILPDSGKEQVIAYSSSADKLLVDAVIFPVMTPNGIWNFAVVPGKGWRNHGFLYENIALGTLISLMLGWITYAYLSLKSINAELRIHREQLEKIVLERTRNLIAARSEAESANAVKTRFMANVSHEMRTPMHSILGYAEVGKARSQTAKPEFLGDCFGSILAAGNQMNRLVEGLLTLANRSWDEQSGLNIQEIDVVKYSHQIGALMELRAEESGQKLVIDTQLTAVTMVVDPMRLQQVFEHLFGNAFRYSGKGATTIFRITEAELPSRMSAEPVPAVAFEIIDQGCGIPDNEMKAVFEPFYESTRTMLGAGGTGLGLPLSRFIVSRHGGAIDLANRPEGGLICKVTLPVSARC